MKQISVNVPEGLLAGLDQLVREGLYPNRAEAVRDAVRILIEDHRSMKQIEEA